MKTVSKNTIAALLLGSTTVFMGGTAVAQQQPTGDAGSSQGGANVILPQDGASGQADTRTGATTQAEELKGGADAAAQGSSEVENGGKSAETAGSTDSSVQAGEAKSPKLDTNGAASTTTTTEKNAEADVPSSKSSNEASTSEPSNETTASIDITTEQRTELRNVIVETKAEPVKLDIDVNVGVVVPRTVELRPLPPRIIEIVPAYRGYEYFVLVDGRIIIVEPGTLKVVYVISA
ncbi:UNVERIFIED_ORG: hypothetical protein J2W19_000503 [Shinella zoogloeoides]|nr:hypothetical protein [Shinella zoogloeoides]